MKRLIGMIIILAVTTAVAWMPPVASTKDYRQVTVSDTAVGLGELTTPVVMLSVHDADVRVRFDGTDPDATTGHLIKAGSFMLWSLETAKSAIFIRDDSDDAVIAITEAYQ